MSSTRIGASLSSAVTTPRLNGLYNESGVKISRQVYINKSDLVTYLSGLTLGSADSDFSSSKLQEVSWNDMSPRTLVVTLSYFPVGFEYEAIPPVGTVTQEADANPISIPLGQLGLSSSLYDETKQVGIGDLDGVEGKLEPQPTYRRSEVLDDFTFSEENIINDVGKIMDPTGMSGPTAKKWLKVGFSVRQAGVKFEQTETWQYADNEWSTDLYDQV